MVNFIGDTVELVCDACEGNIEMGYRVDDDTHYCEDCMLEHLKEDVCEQVFVNEDGEEVDEDDPCAEDAYKFNGNIYKDDESGTFNEILLDAYVDDIVTIEEIEDDYENGVISNPNDDDVDYDSEDDDFEESDYEDEDY